MALARRSLTLASAVAAAAATYACSDASRVAAPAALSNDEPGASASAGVHRQYGAPVRVGEGRARTYVVIDQKQGGRAVELGVALDERAMDGLRAPDPSHGEHGDMDMFDLPLPQQHNTAFQFVELDWNPRGHGAPYLEPHLDFHFYTEAPSARAGITPSDPAYAQKAANDPPAASVPAHYATPAALLGVPAAAVSVPMMGMHWVDVRSPELQMLPGGDPSKFRPFTATFIYGAWDGKFTFMEPMITRAHIVAKRDATDPAVRDEVIPISTSPTYPTGGFRPTAYRIAWDAQAKEYRVALTTAGAGQ
jgi:hypothetical protein